MPRYFFHTMDGKIAVDTQGLEFSSDLEARHEALVAAAQMVLDREIELWAGNTWQLIVANEEGSILCTLRFAAEQPKRLAV